MQNLEFMLITLNKLLTLIALKIMQVVKINLKTPSIMDAHCLDIIVGEVTLCCFSLLTVQHKQVEAPHDPPYLVVITKLMLIWLGMYEADKHGWKIILTFFPSAIMYMMCGK